MNRTMTYTVGLALWAEYMLGLIVGNTLPLGSFGDGIFRSGVLIASVLALAGAVVGATHLKKQIGQSGRVDQTRHERD
jgi:hypothetical protein